MNRYVQERSMKIDSSLNSAAMPPAKGSRVVISVALALTFVCAVLAIETKLLHSDTLVVVMPE